MAWKCNLSSKSIDITKLTVDDIFRAKEQRRKRLASLPFDQKILIVNKLRAAVKAIKGEKPIFASFLRTCPNFAGEPIKEWDTVDEWYVKRGLNPPAPPFDKRPDVIAITTSGKKIGIELKSWINQSQIRPAKNQEDFRQQILKVVGRPPNETKHVGCVRLWPKKARFVDSDVAKFQQELFALIHEKDDDWSGKPDWNQQLMEPINDLSRFPTLQEYLNGVEIHPRPRFTTEWIQVLGRGGAYFPEDMLSTLSTALKSHVRDDRYNEELRNQAGLDELYLLFHYDSRGFTYNTPFAGPNAGFQEAAEFASKVLAGNGGFFDRVFLSCFLLNHEEARRIV
jgi:hypothetical protein